MSENTTIVVEKNITRHLNIERTFTKTQRRKIKKKIKQEQIKQEKEQQRRKYRRLLQKNKKNKHNPKFKKARSYRDKERFYKEQAK